MRVRATLRRHRTSQARSGVGTLHTTRALGRRNQRIVRKLSRTRLQARATNGVATCKTRCPRRMGGASLARADARWSMKVTASSLQRPPVSTPTTTRRQRSPLTSSAYFRSLSARALTSTAPFKVAAFGHVWEADVRADRNVMSTASWAVMDRQPGRQHLDRAHIGCWKSDIHVLKADVAPDCGTGLPTHSVQSAFRANCSRPQPPGPGANCSMATLHVQNCATLAMGHHDLQWQTQHFQNERAEVFWGNLELQPCRSSVQHSAGARS